MNTIERLEKLLAEATPEPWRVNWGDIQDNGLTKLIASQSGPLGRTSPDVRLMVEATNAMPALLRIAKAARAFREANIDEVGRPVTRELDAALDALAALDAVTT